MTDVKPGSIWADNDPRSAGRTLRVDEVKFSPRMGKDVAICTILTNMDHTQELIDDPTLHPWAARNDRRGKTTEIAVRRFVPNSTGYRLISDAS